MIELGSFPASEEISKFLRFAKMCEQVRSTNSKLAKIGTVADYFHSLGSNEDLRIASTFLAGKIFPSGSESQEINVGYSMIWKSIANLYGLRNEDLSGYYMKHGDLGAAIEDYLNSVNRARPNSSLLFESRLTLQSVHLAFGELARSSGKGTADRKQHIIERLLSSIVESIEAKYLVRIMAGEMRIGMVEGLVEESIAKAFSKTLVQVRNANLVTGNIGYVAILARYNELAKAKLELFRPTNFMLADSAENAEALFEMFEEYSMISDYKYDGIRAQIHSSEGKVKIFSRNLEDITRYFPEIEKVMRKHDALAMILDGEIVPFRDGKPLSFQALQQRLRKLERSQSDVPVKYFAFDLLYLKRPMIEEELSSRMKLLRSLGLSGVLGYSEQRLVSSAEEIQSMFEESKSLGYEGLVVKSLSSTYTPGRRGKNWVKLKKELDTLDVVIVAAEYGHGKRAGVISDYTFAVRDGEELKVVGKAYSGLTDSEIADMTTLLKEITVEDHGYRRSVKPQVVLEVAFDAVQKSKRHDSGYALRFPRIKRIRTDKSISQIDTLDKVSKIYESQKVKF
ncbi:MAG: ATP-dependent DNA ligase [Nitrososphaerales archaeon]